MNKFYFFILFLPFFSKSSGAIPDTGLKQYFSQELQKKFGGDSPRMQAALGDITSVEINIKTILERSNLNTPQNFNNILKNNFDQLVQDLDFNKEIDSRSNSRLLNEYFKKSLTRLIEEPDIYKTIEAADKARTIKSKMIDDLNQMKFEVTSYDDSSFIDKVITSIKDIFKSGPSTKAKINKARDILDFVTENGSRGVDDGVNNSYLFDTKNNTADGTRTIIGEGDRLHYIQKEIENYRNNNIEKNPFDSNRIYEPVERYEPRPPME